MVSSKDFDSFGGSSILSPAAKPCKLIGKLTDSESVIIGSNPIEAANHKYFQKIKNLIFLKIYGIIYIQNK